MADAQYKRGSLELADRELIYKEGVAQINELLKDAQTAENWASVDKLNAEKDRIVNNMVAMQVIRNKQASGEALTDADYAGARLSPPSDDSNDEMSEKEWIKFDRQAKADTISNVKTTGVFGAITKDTPRTIRMGNAIWKKATENQAAYRNNPNGVLAAWQNMFLEIQKEYRNVKKKLGKEEANKARHRIIADLGYDPEK